MRELLGTLYVTTQDAVLRLDHDTVRVIVERETLARLPLVRLQAIMVFGRVTVTTPLIHRCAEDGRGLVWLTRRGRFRARLTGGTLGNVLLRRAQYEALADPERTRRLARQCVAGKVQNARTLMLRAARDSPAEEDGEELRAGADRLAGLLREIREATDLDVLRGLEGTAARAYFAAFPSMVRADQPAFTLGGRNRRPPRDRTNALLSFCYALLRAECEAALEGVGLDPQLGYLHGLRPGRPALALDLMEELRPAFADRLVLRVINRRQIRAGHFDHMPGGAVSLNEEGRRATLSAYEKRKESAVPHRLLKERIPAGLVPHVQARLLARHLRGDLQHYLPYLAS
ncbi:MAG: type I-C CRISPR-associated endonuclease Cas1c [Chloroflexi bacterium]|nr:type I-C CRISPR-associated endonuclease Cas1c [Chloroflexota bacterium]